RRMSEHIADQCHDRAQCHLPADAIPGAVHLEEKRNGDHRADSTANRRENDVVETERIKNIAARHHQKTAEPRTCELFGSRAAKAAANPQLIRREPVQVYRRHPSALIKHVGGCLCLRWCVSNEQTTGYYA